jgi:glucose-6-phosphate dehydrogenase assembly protein OpcA
MESFVLALSAFHPGRFFLVLQNGSAPSCAAEIRFEPGSGSGNYCEIVRLTGDCSRTAVVSEAVRGHLMSGLPTELFLYDSGVDAGTIASLAELSDSVVLDSSIHEERLDLVYRLTTLCARVVDLRWIALAQWRDAVREAFERKVVCQRVDSLDRVVVGASTARASLGFGRFCASEVLCAGWLMHRLGLDLISSTALSAKKEQRATVEFTCLSPSRRQVSLVLLEPRVGGSDRLESLRLRLHAEPDPVELSIERGLTLETKIISEPGIHFHRSLIEDSRWGLLKRYLCEGEPLGGYREAIRAGFDLLGLEGDFS